MAQDGGPEFEKLYQEQRMYEFQSLFSPPSQEIKPEQERCVRLVAHVGSAAIRLETIMECLHDDLRDHTLAKRLGTRACEFLRHVVAHRESYQKNEKDFEQQQKIQGQTSKAILMELQSCFDQIRTYMVERKLLSI